jgi:mono/diheme cytochrome c family protein
MRAFFLFLLILPGTLSHRQTAFPAMQKADTLGRPTTLGFGRPVTFGIGRPATPGEIAALDVSIRPDGKGLPPGSGNASAGKMIYNIKCASCHGKTGVEGPFSRLVGPMDDTTRTKTIGNYWPYATTLFDYTRRTMPYSAPGSLSSNEVYSLTAFLLVANRIIDSNIVITSKNLAGIIMPAKKLFISDDRKGGPEIR